MEAKERVSLSEAGRRLNISRQYLGRLAKARKIQIGADGLIDLSEARRYLDAHARVLTRAIKAQKQHVQDRKPDDAEWRDFAREWVEENVTEITADLGGELDERLLCKVLARHAGELVIDARIFFTNWLPDNL